MLFQVIPWSNAFWSGLSPFGPPMWQAEADTELTMSASPATEVGQLTLTMANWRYCMVMQILNCVLETGFLVPF